MEAKKIVALTTAAALSAAAIAAMTGCDQVKALVGQGSIGEAITTSRHVEASDKDKFIQIAGPDGQIYVSVISVESPGSMSIDDNAVKQKLNDAGINWYQMIGSSNMGSPTQETCYVYLAADATWDALNIAGSSLAPEFTYRIIPQAEYQEYVNSANPYDVYHNETTYFGPAAQKK